MSRVFKLPFDRRGQGPTSNLIALPLAFIVAGIACFASGGNQTIGAIFFGIAVLIVFLIILRENFPPPRR